jgi:hypothetical protein
VRAHSHGTAVGADQPALPVKQRKVPADGGRRHLEPGEEFLHGRRAGGHSGVVDLLAPRFALCRGLFRQQVQVLHPVCVTPLSPSSGHVVETLPISADAIPPIEPL